MIRRFTIAFLVIFCLCAALGWWRAGVHAGTQPPEKDQWQSLDLSAQSAVNVKALETAINAGPLFLLSRKAQKALDDGAGLGDALPASGVPAFPKIMSISKLNGKSVVTLIGPENKPLTVESGTTLASGWEIKSIDRSAVLAVYKGEETRFPIVEYLDRAFDKPEKTGLEAEKDE